MMGSGVSSPPPYDASITYINRRQLSWALNVLSKPPLSERKWCYAYSIASASIAAAHGGVPRHIANAYVNAGVVALGATVAKSQLKRGKIQSVDCFMHTQEL